MCPLEWYFRNPNRENGKGMKKTFFFIERECIEFKYWQYTPAVWRVISNTLPLWKKEWHCVKSGWIGKYAPLDNLHPSRADSSWLEAVYCHSFFQSRDVLEITLQTAGVYWQYIKSIHSRPIYKNALDLWIKFCPKKEHIYSDCIIGYHEACNPVQECRTRFVNDKLKALSKRLNALIASKKSLTTTLSIDSVISFSVL